MNIKRNKIKLIFLICLTIVITIVSLITAINLNTKYYLLLAATLPLIYLSLREYQRFNKEKLIANFREKWSIADSRLRNFSELDKHFKKTQAGKKNKYALDEINALLRIINALESRIPCLCLLEKITQEGISFNYKLKKGPSTTRNAIKLLRHIGYPSEIVDASEERVRKAIKDN